MQTIEENEAFYILLVEDSIGFRAGLADMLYRHFPAIRVEEAEDGEIALKEICIQSPDLIFMDIKLPGRNGIDLTKHIKVRFTSIVIVILSSYDLPEYRQAAFRNGADCFIAKDSVSCMEDVLARVEGTIDLKTLH